MKAIEKNRGVNATPTPKRSFSLFGKIFFTLVIGLPICCSALLIVSGNFAAAWTFFVTATVLAIFPAIGLFFLRHPIQGPSTGLVDEFKKFRTQYPGLKGKIIGYGIPAFYVLAVVARLVDSILRWQVGD